MGVILDGPLKDAVVSRESDLVLSIVEGQEPVSFVQGVLACRAARQCVAADGVEHDIDSTAPVYRMMASTFFKRNECLLY